MNDMACVSLVMNAAQGLTWITVSAEALTCSHRDLMVVCGMFLTKALREYDALLLFRLA